MTEEVKDAILNFDLPNPLKHQPRSVVDYALCVGTDELRQTLREINRGGYLFLCATQHEDVYTVFFRRLKE